MTDEAWRGALTDHDVVVVGECLRAMASGEFLDGVELRIRTGLTLADMADVADAWPDTGDPERTLHAVRMAMVALALGGRFDRGRWQRYLSTTPDVVNDLLDRVDEACGRTERTRQRIAERLAKLDAQPDENLHGFAATGFSVRDVVESADRHRIEVPHRLRVYVDARPLGTEVPRWGRGREVPPHEPMTGRYVTLEPLRTDHAEALWECSNDTDVWTYLGYGPWPYAKAYEGWIERNVAAGDPQFYAVMVGGEPRGVLSVLRIDPANGVAEIGHIWYAPSIQRTPATTEATYLVARRVFDECEYRRFEWKCNALNAPSRRAAERFGFTYEGTFRQHMVVKGRNRDTAWFAMTDREWPAIRVEFERWLDPANFDENGIQRSALNASSASTNAWSGSSRS